MIDDSTDLLLTYYDIRFLNLEKEIDTVRKELDMLDPNSQEYSERLSYLLVLLNRMKSIYDDNLMIAIE